MSDELKDAAKGATTGRGFTRNRMSETIRTPTVAIVDFGLGNLYSVLRACERVGLAARITSSHRDVLAADGVILPGAGAFGDAMSNLRRLDLVGPLREIHNRESPLIGICLGLQLMMTGSSEFGDHQGLGMIDGPVVHFGRPAEKNSVLKVPQVGWNRVFRRACDEAAVDQLPAAADDPWQHTPLAGLADGRHMYFVHSYYVRPTDSSVVLSVTRYGDVEFCSAIRVGNTFAFQYHPERSGPDGLRVYRNIAGLIQHHAGAEEPRHAA